MGIIRTNYLYALDPEVARRQIARALEVLGPYAFDAVAFQGLSGAIMAPRIAEFLRVGLIAVRKGDEHSHSCYQVEGDVSAKTYIVVDDFVSSGRTVEDIASKIYNKWAHISNDPPPRLVGVYSYKHAEFYHIKAPGNEGRLLRAAGCREIDMKVDMCTIAAERDTLLNVAA